MARDSCMPITLDRAVLKFITGTENPPPPKTEVMENAVMAVHFVVVMATCLCGQHLHISIAFFAYTNEERKALVHWLPNSHVSL